MSSLKDVTIFVFEASWTDKFKEEEGFLPQASILPYVKALSENGGCNIIYRQIRTEEDLKTWTKAIKFSNSKKRIIWIAGHGIENKNSFEIRMPDYKKTQQGQRLKPSTIKKALNSAGKIEGVIIDSCNFGNNSPKSWIPNNISWALAYRTPVNWSESVFFGIKTIEWLYERNNIPKNSNNAKQIFESGVTTGGYKNKEDRFSLIDFANSLKASFYYRTQGSTGIQTLNSEDIK